MAQAVAVSAEAYKQLFLAVAEELKLPLQHIGRTAELGSANDLKSIQETADISLRLLDGYLLSMRLVMQAEAELVIQPVSLPTVLKEVQKQLQATARMYGVKLELQLGRHELALTNAEALTAALVGLGYALIEALPANGEGTHKLQLATHRTQNGVVAGIYGELAGLTPRALRRGRELYGHVRQPMVGSMPGTSAGVFLADAIVGAMQARLRVGRYHRLPGFAITLPMSQQLQLV